MFASGENYGVLSTLVAVGAAFLNLHEAGCLGANLSSKKTKTDRERERDLNDLPPQVTTDNG